MKYTADGIQTQSLVMRGRSGTVRVIEAYHKPSKLRNMNALKYS